MKEGKKKVIDNPLPMCLPLSQGHGWMASIKENEGGLLTPSAPLWGKTALCIWGNGSLKQSEVEHQKDFCRR